MPTRRLTLPAVAALALACIALGVLAALADGRDHAPAAALPFPARPTAAAPVVRVAPPAAAARPAAATKRAVLRARVAAILRAQAAELSVVVAARGPRATYYATVPPAVLLDTPACRVAEDAPAAEPVPTDLLNAFGVLRRAAATDDALPSPALLALRARGLEPFDPAAARLLRTTQDGGRAWVVPVRDVPAPQSIGARCAVQIVNPKATRPPSARPATEYKPHPGLAVVALDGAPAGAGGRLEDLVRGREAVAVDACGGPNRDMLSVSGIVPDGVAAAFLTSPDGTAIRADVTNNAYAFVVPRSKLPEQRYVVWTGGDGTPHVQPLSTSPPFTRIPCGKPSKTIHYAPVVSPAGSPCPPLVPLTRAAACALTPPTVRVAPQPPRVPKRHP